MLSNILTNKLYIGMIEINKGNKNKNQTTLLSDQQYKTVTGKHELIVCNDLFNAVQKNISKNYRKKKSNNPEDKYCFLLEGLLHCGVCGLPMKKTWVIGHGGVYYYYKCICMKEYVRADIIDQKIISEVRKHALDHHDLIKNSKVKITTGLMDKNKISQFSRRIKLASSKNQKNILRLIVKKIVYETANLNIELY